MRQSVHDHLSFRPHHVPMMWWRFLTFCLLVTFILFVVLSCIHGRPVIHLFFHRCCGEDIENDQVIFENFGTNILRERLVGAEIIEVDNATLFPDENTDEYIDEVIERMRDLLNVHDPVYRRNVTELSDVDDVESTTQSVE